MKETNYSRSYNVREQEIRDWASTAKWVMKYGEGQRGLKFEIKDNDGTLLFKYEEGNVTFIHGGFAKWLF